MLRSLFSVASYRPQYEILRTENRQLRTASTRNRLILLALWLVFYASFTLTRPALLDDADSVHAEVAREMLLRHDWTTLYANGIRYLEKAPLLYWSMAASMRLFGATALAARLPLAFTVLGLALTLESFARRAFRSAAAGLYAALILLSSFGIFIFTRITIPDAMVCLWLTVALYSYWRATELDHPSRAWSYLFAASCALNVLTKGLIGLVFPVGIVLLHLLLTGGLRATLRDLRQLHPWSSLALFLLIAAPWHIAAARANPTQGSPGSPHLEHGHWVVPLPTLGQVHGWTWFYFMNEHVLRYLNLRVPRDYDTVPLALFWGLLLVWLMPWSAFLPHALAAVPWRRALTTSPLLRASPSKREPLANPEQTRLLLGLWAAVPLLFFSFSTRQEYYVLPSIPALVLLLAGWMAEETAEAEAFTVPNPRVRAGQRISRVLLALGTLAALACIYLILHTHAPDPTTDLASLLKQNPGDYALSFGHFLDLNAQAMGAFRGPLALTAVALFGGTLLSFLARERFDPALGTYALAAAAFLFLLAAHAGLVTFSPVLTSAQLARAIGPLLTPDNAAPRNHNSPALVVINGEYESGSTLGFYLHRPGYLPDRTLDPTAPPIHILNGRSSNLWYGSFFTDAPPIFESNASLAAKWRSSQRIFLWTDPTNLPPLPPHSTFLIAASGGKEILSNQPPPQ